MKKSIDVGGVKPLVSHSELHIGRTNPTVRPVNVGKPAYKSQEEQYQEILDLRRNLGDLRENNSSLKAKCRKLEGDLIRRDRQIEQLMDPTKNDEGRRKLTDKGASLVSSLKLRVSRLEETLRDKETQLSKLQASTKTTTINELKVQAETYYQEVVRLRNQLNVTHHQQPKTYQYYGDVVGHDVNVPSFALHNPSVEVEVIHNNVTSPQQENANYLALDASHRSGGDGSEYPSIAELRMNLQKMQEENSRLVQHVSALSEDKEKIASDLDRVLGLSEDVKKTYDGMSRAELIHEIKRTHEDVMRWEQQHKHLTDALSHRSDAPTDNSAALLQARVSELQGRELEWERERVSLRELINTLKDDRLFYKESAQKKDEEMGNLRHEISALQKEVMSLHSSDRRRPDRTTPSRTPRASSRTSQPASSTGSRSGSSSEQATPTRKPRTSSARPTSGISRSSQSSKASSEPRETAKNNLKKPAPTSKVPVRSSSTRTSTQSQSSPSKTSGVVRNRQGSVNGRSSLSSGSTSGSAQPSPRQSLPNRSQSKSGRSSTTSSPQKTASAYRSPSVSSPRSSLPPSVDKTKTRSTSQSSSSTNRQKTSSPMSSGRSSLSKSTPKPSQSSSNSAKSSPAKRPSISNRSSPSNAKLINGKSKLSRDQSSSPASSPLSSRRKFSTDEDISEKALLALLRPADIDSGGESMTESQTQSMIRQRTMTLSVHTDDGEPQVPTVNGEATSVPHTASVGSASSDPHLERQKTVTLTKSSLSVSDSESVHVDEQKEEMSASIAEEKEPEPESLEDEETLVGQESLDTEMCDSMELLRALISAHLNRQKKVNDLLNQEPMLVNENMIKSATKPRT